MALLDIPQDILLKILYGLEVHDVLQMETVCRSARQYMLTDARHLWLVKLNGLDPSCAPDIPPHITIENLSCEELRRIVIRAVRLYWSITKSPTPAMAYTLRKVIVPRRPERSTSSDNGNVFHLISKPKIAPGGRYVLMSWASSSGRDSTRLEEFCVIDTENSNRHVWSYDPVNDPENATILTVNEYEFEIQKDGSIVLAVLFRAVDRNGDFIGLFRVFHLILEARTGIFKATLVYSSQCSNPVHANLKAGSDCPVSGEFTLLWERRLGIITVLKWNQRQVVKIACTRFAALHCFRIWRNHLFYFDCEHQEMKAVSLAEIFKTASARKPRTQLEQLPSTILKLGEIKDQNENPPISASRDGIAYSMYDTPWKDGSQVVFTISLQVSTFFPQFTVVRARFSSDATEEAWKWTVLTARSTVDRKHAYNLINLPSMTRSGKLLFSALLKTGQTDFGIFAVDQQGNPIFPCQPTRLRHFLQDGRNEPHQQSSSPRKEAFIVAGFEEYSGALAVLRETAFGRRSIEIYYAE